MKFVCILMGITSLFMVGGCSIFEEQIEASGVQVVDTMDIQYVKGLDVRNGFEVKLFNSSKDLLIIRTDENYLPHIKREVNGGILSIYKYDETHFSDDNLNVIELHIDGLESLKGSGGSEITGGRLDGESTVVKLSGGSELETSFFVDMLDMELSGGSEVELTGEVGHVNLRMSGGASFEGYEMSCRSLVGKFSGGSEAEVSVSDSLKIDASGGSKVYYDGEPSSVIHASGGGSFVGPR